MDMPATVLVVDDSPTIRQVVEMVLQSRGFHTITAGDGQQALAVLDQQPVDLVLLDFVMPVMNGYQFCRALRSNEALKKLPVVLMSAKGDKIRGQFVQQTGAVDAITKPFDPRALLAVVEAALRKPEERELPNSVFEDNDDQGTLLAAVQELDDIDNESARQAATEAILAQSLIKALLPALSRDEPEPELAQAITSALTPDYLSRVSGLIRLLDQQADNRTALSGDLSAVSIAEVLQLLELQRRTGSLTITHGESTLALYLAEGHIQLAQASNLPARFKLGRFLVEAGVTDRETLNTYLVEPDAEPQLLGEKLVSREVATTDQIGDALKRQTSELTYEAVRWKTGRFCFVMGASSAESSLAALGLAPGVLLMEGFRRVDEWQLIEGSFKFDDVLIVQDAANGQMNTELTESEGKVLRAVNGKSSVRQLVDDVEMGTFDTCKILYQFINSGLVRKTTNAAEPGSIRAN